MSLLPLLLPTPPLLQGQARQGGGVCVRYRQGRWSVFQWKCYVWHAAEAPAAAAAPPASIRPYVTLRSRQKHGNNNLGYQSLSSGHAVIWESPKSPSSLF